MHAIHRVEIAGFEWLSPGQEGKDLQNGDGTLEHNMSNTISQLEFKQTITVPWAPVLWFSLDPLFFSFPLTFLTVSNVLSSPLLFFIPIHSIVFFQTLPHSDMFHYLLPSSSKFWYFLQHSTIFYDLFLLSHHLIQLVYKPRSTYNVHNPKLDLRNTFYFISSIPLQLSKSSSYFWVDTYLWTFELQAS